MKERANRQSDLLEMLKKELDPITGQDLSLRLGVTRQVVVHDIALLRAQGVNVVSTPRGYWIPRSDAKTKRHVLSVSHPPELTSVELFTLVDFGLRVIDVQVEHPVYGELKGSLHLASRRDVELFLAHVEESGAPLLSSLTDGQHMHTVEAPDTARLQEAVAALQRKGVQVLL